MEHLGKPDPGLPDDQERFIGNLNLLRAWAGNPSYAELARLTGIPRSTLADALGHKRKWLPSLDLVVRLVRAFGCTPSEVERWSAAWRWLATRHGRHLADPAGPRPDPPETDPEPWILRLTLDGAGQFIPLHGRDLVTIGSESVLGFAFPPRDLSAAAGNPANIAVFRQFFDILRSLGQAMSPSQVWPMAATAANTLRALAASAAAPLRNHMLLLAARFAEYAGWMAQELGAERAALWWTDKAVELAAAAGDTDLAAYALVRRGLIALCDHDARTTVELARQAQADTGVAARIRGLAAQREAQGHALAGDYDCCRQALDRAAALLAGPAEDGPGGPVIGPSNGLDQAVVATGWCLHDLGRAGEAAEIIAGQLALLPQSAHRARARYATRLALSHATAGDIDQACSVVAGILPDLAAVDSATIRIDLDSLTRTLARCQTYRPVRELYPRLLIALSRTGPVR
jgi:hypothetical protein